MRKTLATLYLLSTIVLFAASSSKPPVNQGTPPPIPPCFPCSEEAR